MILQNPQPNGSVRIDTEGQINAWLAKQARQQPKTNPKRLPTSDDLSSCQSNLDVALCYASAGWSVLPICPTLINQNKDRLNKATTDYKTIENLWSDQPNAPVGIRTGSASGLLVLEHNINSDGTGAGELRQLLKNADIEMRELPTVKTPNGYYYIYKWPKRAKSLAESLNKYVRIRGEGDYIIAPGSRNTKDITHNWYAGDDPSKCSLQIPPHGLLALIQKSESETVSQLPKIKTQINKGRKSSLTPVDLELSVKLRDDCLVEDMLFKRDLALMVGKEAVGKSFITIDLATSLATGQSYCYTMPGPLSCP